ncbi:MAG: ATPase, T2SS/T4P/T4SS family, partial [Planctomycetaceae bacterium]
MQESEIIKTCETESTAQLAARFGMQFVDLEDFEVDQDLVRRFSVRDLFRESVLPLDHEGQCVRVAIADPLNLEALDALTSTSGLFVEAVLARADQIERKLKLALGVGGGTVSDLVAMSSEVTELLEASDDEIDDASQASSVVKLVNEFLVEAVKQRASDVHIEPEEDALKVRYRVDGILRVQPMPPEINRFQPAIINRLKIMAKLNIAEKRLPQDGRITLAIDAREIDEHTDGHVPGAVRIQHMAVLSNADKLATDKPILFICRSGQRSAVAAEFAASAQAAVDGGDGAETVLRTLDGVAFQVVPAEIQVRERLVSFQRSGDRAPASSP